MPYTLRIGDAFDTTDTSKEYYWRFVDNAWGNDVQLTAYEVIKHTPKGTWLRLSAFDENLKRFVLSGATKRFACPTIEEAKKSFIARKERQVKIYKEKLHQAEWMLDCIKQYELPKGKES